MVPAMNVTPPAVVMGPPREGLPQDLAAGIFSVPANCPRGTCHFTSPVEALMAVRVPQGGGEHGM